MVVGDASTGLQVECAIATHVADGEALCAGITIVTRTLRSFIPSCGNGALTASLCCASLLRVLFFARKADWRLGGGLAGALSTLASVRSAVHVEP